VFHISKRRLFQSGLAALAGLAVQGGSISAQDPAPIVTKNSALRLPVEMDPRTRSNLSAIKLYVKGPAGRWECMHTAASNQTAFDFKAPSDGEYKFMFVTVDRRGAATPANVEGSAAHRVVLVDCTPPEITAQPTSVRGETMLQCQIRDANPDTTSLRAMYQASDSTWQPLKAAGSDTPTLFRIPSPEVLKGKIRVSAADRAGNQSTTDVDLKNSSRGDTPSPTIIIDKGRPDPTLLPKDGDPYAAAIPPEVRGAGYSDKSKAPIIDLPPMPEAPPLKAPDATPGIKSPDQPDIRIPGEPAMKLPETPELKMPETRSPIPGPNEGLKLPDVPMIAIPESPGVKPPIDLPPPPAMPPVRSTSALKPIDSLPPEFPAVDKKPLERSGTHPVLNTRTISINYQLEGSARFAKKTDFWATNDGGRSWKALEDQSVGISPAKLILPSDGVFGIRIRPGGGAKQPEPGEEPDCVVEVDSTAPTVNLQPPTIGTDEGSMILTWTASDTNLLGNSINLYYASKADGPWNVIVSGYKNEGVYRWMVPANLTGPIYLRVEAMDRAGNVGRMELPTPVSVETGKQRVKVIGVGPGR